MARDEDVTVKEIRHTTIGRSSFRLSIYTDGARLMEKRSVIDGHEGWTKTEERPGIIWDRISHYNAGTMEWESNKV